VVPHVHQGQKILFLFHFLRSPVERTGSGGAWRRLLRRRVQGRSVLSLAMVGWREREGVGGQQSTRFSRVPWSRGGRPSLTHLGFPKPSHRSFRWRTTAREGDELELAKRHADAHPRA
jgi:hypothetical protein